MLFQGNTESSKYNEEVFKNNLKFGIIDQIQEPPRGYEDIVNLHFYIKRNKLIKVNGIVIEVADIVDHCK